MSQPTATLVVGFPPSQPPSLEQLHQELCRCLERILAGSEDSYARLMALRGAQLLKAWEQEQLVSAPAPLPGKPESLSSSEPTKPALHAQAREWWQLHYCGDVMKQEPNGPDVKDWLASQMLGVPGEELVLVREVDNPPRG